MSVFYVHLLQYEVVQVMGYSLLWQHAQVKREGFPNFYLPIRKGLPMNECPIVNSIFNFVNM